MHFSIICAFDVRAVTLTKQFSYNAGFCLKNAVSRIMCMIGAVLKTSSLKAVVPQASGT